VWPRSCGATSFSPARGRRHAWHLAIADHLAQAERELIRSTRSLTVEVTDPASEAVTTSW
jgi:protein phosphatase